MCSMATLITSHMRFTFFWSGCWRGWALLLPFRDGYILFVKSSSLNKNRYHEYRTVHHIALNKDNNIKKHKCMLKITQQNSSCIIQYWHTTCHTTRKLSNISHLSQLILSQERHWKKLVRTTTLVAQKKQKARFSRYSCLLLNPLTDMLSTEHFWKLNHLLLFLDKDLRSGQNWK